MTYIIYTVLLCGRRKVRIDGCVTKLSGEDTVAIWRGLPREAQLLHSASCQNDVIISKQVRPSMRASESRGLARCDYSRPTGIYTCSEKHSLTFSIITNYGISWSIIIFFVPMETRMKTLHYAYLTV